MYLRLHLMPPFDWIIFKSLSDLKGIFSQMKSLDFSILDSRLHRFLKQSTQRASFSFSTQSDFWAQNSSAFSLSSVVFSLIF
jgi:hypothetical protein